jgi:hypothetical protein
VLRLEHEFERVQKTLRRQIAPPGASRAD